MRRAQICFVPAVTLFTINTDRSYRNPENPPEDKGKSVLHVTGSECKSVIIVK
jgi:hypothetical protein